MQSEVARSKDKNKKDKPNDVPKIIKYVQIYWCNRRDDTYILIKENADQTTCQCIKPQFESGKEVEVVMLASTTCFPEWCFRISSRYMFIVSD